MKLSIHSLVRLITSNHDLATQLIHVLVRELLNDLTYEFMNALRK